MSSPSADATLCGSMEVSPLLKNEDVLGSLLCWLPLQSIGRIGQCSKALRSFVSSDPHQSFWLAHLVHGSTFLLARLGASTLPLISLQSRCCRRTFEHHNQQHRPTTPGTTTVMTTNPPSPYVESAGLSGMHTRSTTLSMENPLGTCLVMTFPRDVVHSEFLTCPTLWSDEEEQQQEMEKCCLMLVCLQYFTLKQGWNRGMIGDCNGRMPFKKKIIYHHLRLVLRLDCPPAVFGCRSTSQAGLRTQSAIIQTTVGCSLPVGRTAQILDRIMAMEMSLGAESTYQQ